MRFSILGKVFGKASAGGTALALAASLLVPAAGAFRDDRVEGLHLHPSNTAHSKHLRALERRFNTERADVEVVVMDPDAIALNKIVHNYDTISGPPPLSVADVMKAYFNQKTGLRLPVEIFSAFQGVLDSDANFNVQHMETRAGFSHFNANICMVFSHGADGAPATQIREGLLNLSADIHGEFARFPLNKNIRADAQKDITLYHEIVHCFSPGYGAEAERMQREMNSQIKEQLKKQIVAGMQKKIPDLSQLEQKMILRKVEDLFLAGAFYLTAEQEQTLRKIEILRQKEEMFMDIAGVLLKSQEGIAGLAAERADLRLAGAALGGPVTYYVRNMPFSPGINTGFIYTMHKGLRTTQKKIDELGDKLKTMSFREIMALSKSLTDDNALDRNAALGSLFLWHSANSSSQMGSIDMTPWRLSYSTDSYDYQAAYRYAQNLLDEMNDALPRVFDMRAAPAGQRPVEMITFNFDAFKDMSGKHRYKGDNMAVTAALKNEIIKRAGDHADMSSLVHAYEQYKDELRRELSDDSNSEHPAADHKVTMMPEALRGALYELKYGPMPTVEDMEKKLHDQFWHHDDVPLRP